MTPAHLGTPQYIVFLCIKSLNCFVLPAWGGCVGDKGQEVGRQTADAGDPDVLYDLPELSKEGASGSVPAHSEGRHLCRHSMIKPRDQHAFGGHLCKYCLIYM